MNCCKLNCVWLAVLAGILAGVLLGVLYAVGLVSTGIVFWAYLGLGILGLLLAPIYATGVPCDGNCECFARYRTPILVGAIGTIITAAVGLIAVPVVTVVAAAVILGFATLLAVFLLATLACLAKCR